MDSLDYMNGAKNNIGHFFIIESLTDKIPLNISNDSIYDDGDLKRNASGEKTLLVLFTTFMTNQEKFVCRNNTVKNWASLAPFVQPVFFSNDEALSNKVRKSGWDVMRPKTSHIGVPILKFMYLNTMKAYNAHFYGYSNGDLLFTNSLVKTLQTIMKTKLYSERPMLIIGQRTNVRDVTEKQASTYENIIHLAKKGQLFTPLGIDFFITDSKYPWKDYPEVVIGRVAYDNFIVLNARKENHTTIDVTRTLLAVHQTTRAGNYEGSEHPHANFNKDLLKKYSSIKQMNWRAGIAPCASFYTALNHTANYIQILPRKIGNRCFPVE